LPCDRLCSFGRISRDSIYLYRKTKASTIGSSELPALLFVGPAVESTPRCSTLADRDTITKGGGIFRISLTQTSKPCCTRFGLDIRIQIVHMVRLNVLVYATPGRFRWRKRAARPGARLRSRGRTSLAARLGRGPHRTAPRCQRHRAGGGRDGRARLINSLVRVMVSKCAPSSTRMVRVRVRAKVTYLNPNPNPNPNPNSPEERTVERAHGDKPLLVGRRGGERRWRHTVAAAGEARTH